MVAVRDCSAVLFSFTLFLFKIRSVKTDDTETSTKNSRVLPKVDSITLSPESALYRVDETYLLDMNLKQRRTLCKRMRSEIKDSITVDKNCAYFVPGAHMFNFDGEDWLSVLCPSTPPFYVFHELISDTDMWYTRAIKNSIDDYKFNFETAIEASEESEEEIGLPVPSENDIYLLEKEQRWKLCNEARERIRYNSIWNNGPRISQPRIHKFKYFNGLEEFYHAFSCSTEPAIYLHTSYSKPSKALTITLVGKSAELSKSEQKWKSHDKYKQ